MTKTNKEKCEKYAYAKALTIKVWHYLAKHPTISDKNALPLRLYNKIDNLVGRCPLCVYAAAAAYEASADTARQPQVCERFCPLGDRCVDGTPYARWVYAASALTEQAAIDARREAAEEILARVKAWKRPDVR